MSTNNNTQQQTNQQKALDWWRYELRGSERDELAKDWYGKYPMTLDENEITEIWRKETTQPIPTCNTVLTDREKALQWWKARDTGMRAVITRRHLFYMQWNNLSADEIEYLWRKETSPTTFKEGVIKVPADFPISDHFSQPASTVKEGEEGFTKGEWVVDEQLPAIVRLSKYLRIEQVVEAENVREANLTEKEIDRLLNGSEAEANAHLIAASKDLYYALCNLINNYDNPKIPDWAEGSRLLMNLIEDGKKALKKANPKLP